MMSTWATDHWFLLQTAPLSVAVQQLSVKLNVPPSRILLLRKDMELPVDSTANELGLGIADIIGEISVLLENVVFECLADSRFRLPELF